jgi:hypothetical protein
MTREIPPEHDDSTVRYYRADALDYLANHSDECDDAVREVLQYVDENPRDAVENAEEIAKRHAPEAVEGWNGLPATEFDPFHVTFRSEGGVVEHPEYGSESEVMECVRDILGRFQVVPPSPLVSVTVQ